MRAPTINPRTSEPFGAAGSVRVLLASDGLTARLTLEAVLEKSGYCVDSAVSAADAMEKIESQQYDLVLCDLKQDCGELRRFAGSQPYRPATAIVQVCHEHPHEGFVRGGMVAAPVDVEWLLA